MKKSFTLIELTIAISLLTLGIGGVYALISNFFVSSSISSQKLIAAYLAQEGVEIVRNIRDTNLLEGEGWDSDLNAGEYYNFDYRSQAIPDNTNCNGRNYLVLNLISGYYQCSNTSNPLSLQRKVSIDKSTPDVLKIKVQVFWRERGRLHQIEVQENLYKWE